MNLTTEALCRATDYCGVKSGRDVDKWAACGLTPEAGQIISAPLVAEAPVSIECRVTEKKSLGSHTMFIAEVVAVHVDEAYMDGRGTFRLEDARPIVYSHGTYFALGKQVGTFGYSVKKKAPSKKAVSGRPSAKKAPSGRKGEKRRRT